MNVSLDQAIEIHAKALKHRFGERAPLLAEEKADHCAARGDDEGYAVWRPSCRCRRNASCGQAACVSRFDGFSLALSRRVGPPRLLYQRLPPKRSRSEW